MRDKTVSVNVTFTEVQMECLESLKREGRFGNDYGEIIATIFHEYVRAALGKGEH